ncbi:hypothetical protein FHS43_003568 [Streptosporangium becharense]|uniref:Uncharacterized protein n=1 Tax=Streptosporangium becharense TaxID=1816182 RepID=A0A7W9IDR9_9ACTN|nr:hypothetical protein [Streptosporangium becharense]MBB2912288.1 hypothetical protein [Streptosporangium becharense]MBB5818835.1 hypothetical protein [Streptosporangium becharense]
MVLSLFVGMALGVLGALLVYGPSLPHALYDPYAYVVLAIVVGWTAAGFGWAVLSSTLATFGSVISLMAASIFEVGAGFPSLGTDGAATNLMIFTIASIGVLSYLAKREDLWGDLAAGAAAGLAVLDGLDKSLPGGPDHVPGFWPWGTLTVSVLGLGTILTLRRGRRRICSALVALAIASSYFVFVAGL